MLPERELNPRASFWREGREQMASKGREPFEADKDKPWLERSIWVMFPAVLQETPRKLQVGVEGVHEERRLESEDWREDLRVRRESTSSAEAELEKQRRRRRKRRPKQGNSGGIVGGRGMNGGKFWCFYLFILLF